MGAACGRPAGRSSSESVLEAVAEQYVRLALQLAQHQPSLVEAWTGPPEWRPGPRQPVASSRRAIDALIAQLRALRVDASFGGRRKYLAGQLAGLSVAARRLSGEATSFADEAREALALEPEMWRSGADESASARASIDRLVPGAGGLHLRLNRLRRRLAVPPAQLEKALTSAVAACRDRVRPWLSLPAGERVSVGRDAGVDAEARATWAGDLHTVVRLDERAAPDIAHLVWLAAHESYGGHHLQHVLAAGLSSAGVPAERQLHPAFGPHLLYAEGSAEAGAALLLEGEAFAEICADVCRSAAVPALDIERLVALHRALRAIDLVIPQVAEAYLDGALTHAAAAMRLADEGLVTDAAAFLGVIERQRTRVLGYPVGRRLVSRAMSTGGPHEQWARLGSIAATLTID